MSTYEKWKIKQMREVREIHDRCVTRSAPVFKAAQDSPESDLAVTPGCAGADTAALKRR